MRYTPRKSVKTLKQLVYFCLKINQTAGNVIITKDTFSAVTCMSVFIAHTYILFRIIIRIIFTEACHTISRPFALKNVNFQSLIVRKFR